MSIFHDRIIKSNNTIITNASPINIELAQNININIYGQNFNENMKIYVHGPSGMFNEEEILINNEETSYTGLNINYTLINQTSITAKISPNITGNISIIVVNNNVLNKFDENYIYGHRFITII